MRFGTRRSPLAQAQTDLVLARCPGEKVVLDSDGDHDAVRPLHQLDAPGAFTHTLTTAILDGRIDAAVHSLKDLPLEAPDGAPVVAVLERHDCADILLVRAEAADANAPLGLRIGSRVGTSAPRRQTQVRGADGSLVCVDVRGNVQTRIGLLEAGVVDGLLMAAAVFERLDVPLPDGVAPCRLDPTRFPGSPGQGAIAVQAAPDHADALAPLDHAATRTAVDAERAVLEALGGGCGLPLGCHVACRDGTWHLWATMGHPEGLVRVHLEGNDPLDLVAPAVDILQHPPRKGSGHKSEAASGSAPASDARPSGPTVALTLSPDRLPAYQATMPGVRFVAWPLITTEDTHDSMPEGAAACRWIAVTSRRAAQAAAQAFHACTRPPRVAAVSAATTDRLRELGLPVHVVASDGTGRSLADAIAAFPKPPETVLITQAEDADPGLGRGLAVHGFSVLAWRVYRTLSAPTPRPPCDVVVLCSPSAARIYTASGHPDGPRLVAFGPTTAAAMEAQGLPVHAVCQARGPTGVQGALATLEVAA